MYSIEQLWLWLEEQGPAVFAEAKKQQGDVLRAEEVFEEVFLQVIRCKPTFESNTAERAWFLEEVALSGKRLRKLAPPSLREPLPFEELQAETYQLMLEAQAHNAALPPKDDKKNIVLFSALGGALLLIALAIALPLALLGQGDTYEDEMGVMTPVGGEPAKPDPGTDPQPSADPGAPELVNDANTQSFASLQAFIDALTDKTAKGYGSNYYNTRALLLLPTRLPDGARFRQLQLDIASGRYAYSYLVTAGGTDYFLNVTAAVQPPKTLAALEGQLEGLAKEKRTLKKSEQKHLYRFGSDSLSVTVAPVEDEAALDPAVAEQLLSAFAPARRGADELLALTY